MLWILADVAVATLALVALGLVGFSLYKHVRTLMRTFGTSSSTLGDAAPDLNGLQTKAPQRR